MQVSARSACPHCPPMEGTWGGYISWLPAVWGRALLFNSILTAIFWGFCNDEHFCLSGAKGLHGMSQDNSSRKYADIWTCFCPLLVMSIAKPRSTSRVGDMRQYGKLPMEAPLRSTQFLPRRTWPLPPCPITCLLILGIGSAVPTHVASFLPLPWNIFLCFMLIRHYLYHSLTS